MSQPPLVVVSHLEDLSVLLSDYGNSGPDAPGDADGDGDTDTTDLSILLGDFGVMCS